MTNEWPQHDQAKGIIVALLDRLGRRRDPDVIQELVGDVWKAHGTYDDRWSYSTFVNTVAMRRLEDKRRSGEARERREKIVAKADVVGLVRIEPELPSWDEMSGLGLRDFVDRAMIVARTKASRRYRRHPERQRYEPRQMYVLGLLCKRMGGNGRKVESIVRQQPWISQKLGLRAVPGWRWVRRCSVLYRLVETNNHAAMAKKYGPSVKGYLSEAQAAKRLGLSPWTLNAWRKSVTPRIPSCKIGGFVRYKEDDVATYETVRVETGAATSTVDQ